MKEISAGLLMYRKVDEELQIFLVHPGGPYWANKNEWGVPKGKIEEGEGLLDTAQREFQEETNLTPNKPYIFIGSVYTSRRRKKVFIWAFPYIGVGEPEIKSNPFEMEYPKGSGKINKYPEVDKGRFFSIDEAREIIHPYQLSLIDMIIDNKQLRISFIDN